MNYASMGGSGKQYWTPRWFVRAIERTQRIKFVVDMAACAESTVAPVYYDGSPGKNALEVDWAEVAERHCGKIGLEYLWCNPPWDNIGSFLLKYREYPHINVCFCLPNRPEAKWGRFLQGLDLLIVAPRINYYDPKLGRIRSGNGIGTILAMPIARGGNTWCRIDVSSYKPVNESKLKWPV